MTPMSVPQPLPEELALKSKPFKWVVLTLFGALMLAGSIWLAMRKPEPMAWASIAFFGLMTALGLWLLKGTTLRLDKHGVTQTGLGRNISYAWSQTSAFGGYSTVQGGFTTNSFATFETFKDPEHPEEGTRTAQLVNFYGLKPEEFVELLNAFRNRSLIEQTGDAHANA